MKTDEIEPYCLRRYLDDEFIMGIDSDTLAITGASIPMVGCKRLHSSVSSIQLCRQCHVCYCSFMFLLLQEPMYLVFNTAVSHSWGFPEPCDKNTCGVCYHCYDCTNPGRHTLDGYMS